MAIGLYKIKGVMYYFGKDGICNGKYTGFAKNSKGKLYYKNGVKVTKNTTIDGVRYKFSSDGCCKGYFTGFTRSSQGRKYWSNGILAKDKWVQDSKGNYYYAGNDGYLLTGWQKVTRIGGNYSYFYENGIWDGKVYHKRYIQNNLRAVFKDMDYFGGNKFFWSYNNHSDSNMKPFIDIDVVYSIVEKDLDKTLLWDEEVSYDEIDTAPIYHGGKKIIIRSSIRKSIDLEFTKDKKGNSYLYNSYFGFGLELTDSDAYDKIKALTEKE